MITRLLSLLVVTAIAGMSRAADVQQQPGASGKPSLSSAAAGLRVEGGQSRDASDVIPELVFEGGTVRQLIAKLRQAGTKAGLQPLNVMVEKNASEENSIPPFELHNVRYGDVFEALNTMRAGGAWEVSSKGSSIGQVWVLRREPQRVEMAQQFDPLTGQPINTGPQPKVSQIYQLQRYLNKYKVEDITTAIQTAWAMVDLSTGTELKYHKDTTLLIAVGRPEQLDVISRVLHALEEGLAASPPAKKEPAEAFINGAVNKPGTIALGAEEDLDILGALARAGGLSARANESRIRFTRPGLSEKTFSLTDLKAPKREKIILKPGDIIEVGEKLF